MTLSIVGIILLVLFCVGIVISVINGEFRTGTWWLWVTLVLAVLLTVLGVA